MKLIVSRAGRPIFETYTDDPAYAPGEVDDALTSCGHVVADADCGGLVERILVYPETDNFGMITGHLFLAPRCGRHQPSDDFRAEGNFAELVATDR